MEGRLYLTGGAKLENNPYTGNEWQPSGRLLFLPDDNSSLWAAVSRAVRIPTQLGGNRLHFTFTGCRLERLRARYASLSMEGLVPNPTLQAETLISYELGFRTAPTKDSSLDIAGFYNHYEQLIAIPSVNGVFTNSNGGVFDPSTGLSPFAGGQQRDRRYLWGGNQRQVGPRERTSMRALAYTYQDYDQAMINASSVNLGAPPPHNLASCPVDL